MTEALTLGPSALAQVRQHLGRFALEGVETPGGHGLVSLDGTGANPVLTLMTVGVDGQVTFTRATIQASRLPQGAAADGRGPIAAAMDCLDAPDTRTAETTFSEGLEWFGLRRGTSGLAKRFAQSFAVTYPAADAAPEAVAEAMDRMARTIAEKAVGDVLDSEAIHALRAIGTFPASAYAFYAVHGDRRVARHQAAAAYPLLAGAMSQKFGLKMAVDSRKPLGEAFEKAFGVDPTGRTRLPKALQKRIQGLEWGDGNVPFEVVADALAGLPPEWFPKSETDWKAFLDVADTLLRYLPPIIGENSASLANGCGGKWAEFRRRVAKSATNTMPPEDLPEIEKERWKPVVDDSKDALSAATLGVIDMVRHFRDLVLLPVSADGAREDIPLSEETKRAAGEVGGRLLCRGKSLPAILDLQRAWHTRAASINESVVAEDVRRERALREERLSQGVLREVPEDGWAPLCNVVVAPNGVTVMPLVSPLELTEEGCHGTNPDGTEGLHHCVGGYVGSCKQQGHHIVSFRDYDEEPFKAKGKQRPPFVRLSTAEFGKLDADSNKVSLRQNRSRHNTAPSHRAQAAYDWFVTEVESGNIPINRAGIMTYMTQRVRPRDDVQDLAGYDRRSQDLVAIALRAWTPLMDKRFRDIDVEGLRSMPELEDLVEAVAPSFRPSPR